MVMFSVSVAYQKEDSSGQPIKVASRKYLYWLKHNQASCLNAFNRIFNILSKSESHVGMC